MKKFKRKNKKLGDIFVYAVLSCLLLNISLLSTSATSPEFSIIMTNKSSNLEFALSGDGQNIVSHGYNWTHLAKIPSRFGEESENIWNITLDDDIMNSDLNLDITYDGSKVVVVDQNEGKFNCYSNVGTTPV